MNNIRCPLPPPLKRQIVLAVNLPSCIYQFDTTILKSQKGSAKFSVYATRGCTKRERCDLEHGSTNWKEGHWFHCEKWKLKIKCWVAAAVGAGANRMTSRWWMRRASIAAALSSWSSELSSPWYNASPCISSLSNQTRLKPRARLTAISLSCLPLLSDSITALRFNSAIPSLQREASNAMNDHVEKPTRSFQVVVAATRKNGIGKNGQLPWTLPSDMKFFKQVTLETASPGRKNAMVMGHTTWLSIPEKFRPLPGRLNVILSRTKSAEDFPTSKGNVLVSGSLYDALELLATPQHAAVIETIYVIGGGQIFGEAMTSPFCDAIHFTEIDSDFNCDTFCPAVDTSSFAVWASSSPVQENGIRRSFVTHVRKRRNRGNESQLNGGRNGHGHVPNNNNLTVKEDETSSSSVGFLAKFILHRHEEYQYLHLIKEIIETGNVKGDRTGTGTISKFGCQMQFNLRKSFPLLTTKRVHWRGILEELLWFISGSTNAKVLQEKGIHIWDGNSSKEYLDSLGLTDREEGDLGPIYGFQWRHFGAKYTNMHADYSGQGFDQLADAIHKIRTNPDDRRIMISAWNPADLHLMALPPCHMFAQFYVANGELSCQMYQRSCDMGLGVPYNIASYSLLTCMIAYVCDLVPGDFVHVLGDAHVYKNHVEPLQLQLKNTPKPFPILKIKSSAVRDIDSLTVNDFEMIGYESSKKIVMQMSV